MRTAGVSGRAKLAIGVVAIVLANLAVGCGAGGTTVSGEVTYEAAPVASGQIMFTPADGKGPIVGGPISAGHYSVSDLSPGQKLVQISSIEDAPVVLSSEDLAKAAQTGKAAAPPAKVVVPANAIGNGASVEIKSGSQSHNFHLKKPARD